MSDENRNIPLGRILLVDDEKNLLEALRTIIAGHGYEVAEFTTGPEALAALREKEFDILLTDLMMPGMNGMDVFRKATEIDPLIVGIVMTGYGTIQNAIEAMKGGAFDYLLKPFKAHSMLPLLDRAIAVRRLKMENIQLRQTVAIYELGQAIGYSMALNTILDKVADGALQQCEADETSIMLPMPGGKELYVAAVRGKDRAALLGQRVPIDRHVAGWVARHGEPIVLKGAVSDPRYQPVNPRKEIELAVSLPLLVAGRLAGILNLNFTHPRRSLTVGELKALSIFCSIAGSAIETARLHEELRAAEQKYRGIFENSIEGIFLTSRDGKRFIAANSAMARLLGYGSPDELVGGADDIGGLIFSTDGPCREIRRLLDQGTPIAGLECECIRKDGSRIWVMLNAAPVMEGGQRVGCGGSMVDITSRRSAEESLARERSLLSTVIDNIPDVIYVKDTERRFLHANASMRRLLGVGSLVEMAGKTDQDFFPHEMAEQFAAEEGRILTTGEALTNKEERALGADGRDVWFLTTKVPLKDESGALKGLVGINRDVTALRESQNEIRNLARFPEENPNPIMRLSRDGVLLYANAASRPILDEWRCARGEEVPGSIKATALKALASATLERTELLCGKSLYLMLFAPIRDADYINLYALEITEQRNLEQQLMQSQKMDAIGRLAGGVAHDFNNVLTVILGYSYSLQKRLGSDDANRQEVEKIEKAALRAASLTQQLLALSRKQILQTKVLDFNDIVSGMEKMLRRLVNESVSIDFILEPSLGRIRADGSQIEQILLNLVINASHAMPLGGKILIETANVELDEGYASAHTSAKPGPHIRLVVSDTGMGMDAETRERVFEPFFTTKESGKGTGLGLSVVYGIVKQSGGNIWIYSEPGKGTSFKVYLPRVFESAQEPVQVGESPARGSETILVVEDEEMIRQIISVVLTEFGYTALLAKDGDEALEMCAGHQGPIHLLLSDVVLPKMSGRESAKRLVSLRPSMRVLYMSGYTENAIAHHGVLEPRIAFIQKPFAPASLLSKVREILDYENAPAY